MRKKKTSFIDKIKVPALNIIPSLLASIIFEIVIKPYIDILGWLNKHNMIIGNILIPLIVIIIILIALAFFFLFKKGIEKKLKIVIPPILFVCGTLLIVISFHIAKPSPPPPTPRDLIASQEINMELLLEKNKIDIPVKNQYNEIILVINYPEGASFLPELELEKISPLKGNWDILVPGDTAEKLIITGLEAAKENELYYRPRNGEFKVLDIEGREVSLGTENKIRINTRNFAGFEETIEFIFYGIKTQGEKK